MIYTKQIGSIGSYDVCVLGGGPSGVAAVVTVYGRREKQVKY